MNLETESNSEIYRRLSNLELQVEMRVADVRTYVDSALWQTLEQYRLEAQRRLAT